jgi:hypothetical protein
MRPELETGKLAMGDGAELRFQADPADGLSCVGVTPRATTEPSLFHASFFRIYGIQFNTKNSWEITGYEIAGGKYTLRQDRDSLISFDFAVAGQGSAFKCALHTITFSKPDGVCSDALAQAFDRPE